MYKARENQKLITSNIANVVLTRENSTLILSGSWSWPTIDEIKITQALQTIKNINFVSIDGQSIEYLDTVGAYFINKIIQHLQTNNIELKQLDLSNNNQKFFTRLTDNLNSQISTAPVVHKTNFVHSIGLQVSIFNQIILDLISFFGQFVLNCLYVLKSPLSLNWNEVFITINKTGVKGVWIAMLLSFLIGVTLTYEMAPQFVSYGANLYVVNFLGIALLKEVSPLLTAVIVAGRTGASITAEIGTMKVQQEIDAIRTMGISPMKRLILPKVIGVMIALPLITAISDLISLLGGAIVANHTLDVNYSLFLERLQNYVSVNNFTDGIIKSVAFGLLIALIGCFCGLSVRGNAASIGQQTTRSVVLGIFFVVFADAIFAIIFQQLGI